MEPITTIDASLSPELCERLQPQPGSALPKVRQLYLAIYAAIECGDLPLGFRLPASRDLATRLKVARNTVVAVYEQLNAEGLVSSDGRRGTVITYQSHATSESESVLWPTSKRSTRLATLDNRHAAFTPGAPDSTLFPADAWRRALSIAARRMVNNLGYQNQTSEHFREQVARYLLTYRSLRVNPEQIIATTGTRQSLNLAALLFTDPGDVAWVESPGYPGAPDAWASYGLDLKPCPIDEHGMVLGSSTPRPQIVYTTPCFQYPLGMPLSLGRRQALVDMSTSEGTVIFEDDYDSEFRSDTQPRPALAASSAKARVLHAGTFSKLIFPAVRVGWLVVPASAIGRAHECLKAIGGGHHAISQEAVSELLQSGAIAHHLRRAKQVYENRISILVDAVSRSDALGTAIHRGGLTIIVPLAKAVPLARLEAELDRAQLGAVPLERYRWETTSTQMATQLVLGVGTVDSLSIPDAIERLNHTVRVASNPVKNS